MPSVSCRDSLSTRLTRSETFAKFSLHLGFHEYVLISEHVESIGGRRSQRIMEDVFEAFCAALKQDLGYDVLEQFIVNLIRRLINLGDLVRHDDNYKDKLLRFFPGLGKDRSKCEISSRAREGQADIQDKNRRCLSALDGRFLPSDSPQRVWLPWGGAFKSGNLYCFYWSFCADDRRPDIPSLV